MTTEETQAIRALLAARLTADGRTYSPGSLPGAASWARERIKLRQRWAEEEASGCVRLRWIPDEFSTFEDLAGDCFKPESGQTNLRALKAEEKAFKRQIDRDGVWGLAADIRPSPALPWRPAASCFGIVGQEDEGGFLTDDIMAESLEELEAARAKVCPCCNGSGIRPDSLRELRAKVHGAILSLRAMAADNYHGRRGALDAIHEFRAQFRTLLAKGVR